MNTMKPRTITTTTTRRALLAAATLALATASTSSAAVVNWGAATNIAGDSDVSTAGSLVGAFNLGGAGVLNTTVNGVVFNALALSGNNVTSGNFNLATAGTFASDNAVGSGSAPFSNLSAPYQSLLSTTAGAGLGGTFTLTMNALTLGTNYQFQFWVNDSIAGQFNTTATAGNSVTLVDNVSQLGGGTGQFAIGTFIASGASQSITFTTTTTLQTNGFQLRALPAAVAVPEPGSALAGMLALGACAGGLLRRNREGAARA